MKHWISITGILLLAAAGTWMGGCADYAPRPAEHSTRLDVSSTETSGAKVIILVIDGLRYTESFGDPTLQHIPFLSSALAPQGTLFDNFYNTGDTRTVPGHAAIATGTWQYIANDGSEHPDKPTVFEYYRKTYAAASNETWVVSGKAKITACTYSTHPEYGAAYGAMESVGLGSDTQAFAQLITVLETDRPSLVLVNFNSVDAAGHTGVWEQYIDAIETADSLAAEIWEYLQSDTVYAGTTYLFIANDHGRHDDANGGFENHGCGCEGCQHVMLLALGPDIQAGHTVTNFYTLRDLCRTTGEILGFDTPEAGGSELTEMYIPSLTGIETD